MKFTKLWPFVKQMDSVISKIPNKLLKLWKTCSVATNVVFWCGEATRNEQKCPFSSAVTLQPERERERKRKKRAEDDENDVSCPTVTCPAITCFFNGNVCFWPSLCGLCHDLWPPWRNICLRERITDIIPLWFYWCDLRLTTMGLQKNSVAPEADVTTGRWFITSDSCKYLSQ